ncbi:mitochondrial uncoupling protein 4 isoform X2 [Homalodisca vitripennis]|uniref:mitochondrial uncoupling protein 4 isoform X2 n=1 Tax=Homalodisca vitripennis TaxID=197043 RepID=UPI001EEC4457|nr:mitochondrial uncoupling protein 4 isoform X2 [Homalodisca vitripennis]
MSKRSLIFRSADDGKCKNSQEWSADKMAVHNTLEHKAPQYNYADSFWCTYLVSVVAASIAEMLTYPLDLTKTRLQIQGELAAGTNGVSHAPYRGMLKTALGIVQEEGVPKLWQGVTPAIYRHVVYSGIRIVAYEKMRDNVLKKDSTGAFPIWKSAIAGVTSGALAQFIASPTDLVKVQIQMEGKRRLMGKAPRVHGTVHAFQKIVSEGGLRGLWKGSIPNMQRAALVNLGDLTTYDTAKQFILSHTSLPDSHLVHILSSACAGLVAATMGTPADVVKTRIMNQPTDAQGRGVLYKSSIDCLMKTVHNEGAFALYKGFLPVWIRMAPWSLTFWLSFEQIRHMLGATGF